MALFKHQAEHRLRESEEKYHRLFNRNMDAIFVHRVGEKGEPGTFIDANDVAVERLGWTREELLRMTPLDICAPESGAPLSPDQTAKIMAGESVMFEQVHMTRDGRRIPVEVHIRMFLQEGSPVVMSLVRDITDRKKTEAVLIASEQKHRLVVENINDIIYRIRLDGHDMAGRVDFVGGRTDAVTGYRAEEFMDNHGLWFHLIHPDDRTYLAEITKKILDSRQPGVREYRLYKKGLTGYCWIEDKVTPEYDGQGALIGYFGVARDITERKRAEELFRQSHDTQMVISELLRISVSGLSLPQILERAVELALSVNWFSFASRGCIFLSDGKGGLVLTAGKNLDPRTRERCARIPEGRCLCGQAALRKEPVYAEQVDERHEIHHEGETDHGHYCIPILRKEKLLGVLNVFIRQGHRRNDLEIQFLTAVSNVLAGIIDRKNAEADREKLLQRLRESYEMVFRSKLEWEETFDSISDQIYITDEGFTIIKANRAFAERMEMDIRDIIGKKCHLLLHGTASPPDDCPHTIALREGKQLTSEITEPNTGRVFHVSTYPYRRFAEKSRGSIMVMKDVTAEREREMQMIMNERLAALGQMAAGIAHEINNPLTAVMGCAEGLMNRVNQERFDPALFSDYLRIIGEETDRCKKITTSMLSFVRTTSYETREIDIHDAIEKSLEIIGFQGRMKNITVTRNYLAGAGRTQASEGELKQALLAVITNAVDAMQERGMLTVSTGIEEGRLFITVTDSGPGMTEEQAHRIFYPFFTTKSESGGTGLGLSIARKLLAGQQGDIRVSSKPGKGAAFTITLPIR